MPGHNFALPFRTPIRIALVLGAVLVLGSTVKAQIIVIPPPEYTFRVGSAVGAVGDFVSVVVDADIFGAEAYSWHLNVCHDPFRLIVHNVSEGADLAALDPDFSVIQYGGNGWTHSVITNLGWVDFERCLPVGSGRELDIVTYEIIAPGPSTVCFCGGVSGIVPAIPLSAQRCALTPTDVTDIAWECGVISTPIIGSSLFIRGDANGDGIHNIADAIRTIDVLFGGALGFGCDDAADTNDDGLNDLADAIYTLAHFFAGGPVPPPPYSFCGMDPTPDGINCVFSTCP